MRVLGGGAVDMRSRLPAQSPPARNIRAAVTSRLSPTAASDSHSVSSCVRTS